MAGQETTIAIIAILAVVVLLLVWLFAQRRRTQALREDFGEEYDRTVAARGGRRQGEADLIERKERVRTFDIRPLTTEQRERYIAEWKETKTLFFDNPVEAVGRADRLLTEVMDARGFPMADFEKRHADLTVEHREAARHYLEGHEIAERTNDATTEELRRAINHYEALFSGMTSRDKNGVLTERSDASTKPAAFSTTTKKPG